MRPTLIWKYSLLMLLVFSGVGVAQESPKSKVLVLRVTSNKLPAEELERLTSQVMDKLRKYPALEALPVPPEDPMDLMVDAECVDLDAACLSTIGAARGADAVLYLEVSEQEGRFQVQVKYVDVKTKELRSPEGGTEVRAKVWDLLALAVEKVFGPEPLPETVLARVDIETSPTGADIYLDKEFVGVSPVTLRLKKGRYIVRASRVGFEEKSQVVDIEAGKALAIRFTLEPLQVALPEGPVPVQEREQERPAFYETWWFWTAVGAVVVGAGTTAVLLTTRKGASPTGSVVFAINPASAARDITLYPSKLPVRQ